MYEVALTVQACVGAGTEVDVAWAVGTTGFDQADRAEAVAFTPGGGRVGGLLGGVLDGQLADAARTAGEGRLVDLEVGDLEASAAGLPGGGRAQCLVVPAARLPEDLWPLLLERAPVALVSRLDGDVVTGTDLHTEASLDEASGDAEVVAELLDRGESATRVTDDAVVTVLHPVPRLVVAGGGPIADALGSAAALLGWHVQRAVDKSTATGLVAGLAAIDHVVVVGHDVELTGPALETALGGPVGYIGSIGPERVQGARADWLADHGVTDLSRVHGPAGLDIGAGSPPEIAVAVLAEAIAARSAGTVGGHANDRKGAR